MRGSSLGAFKHITGLGSSLRPKIPKILRQWAEEPSSSHEGGHSSGPGHLTADFWDGLFDESRYLIPNFF